MKPIVAIIDDDDDVRDVMCYALDNEDIASLPLENGKLALDYLKALSPENYPCLLIVDYMMPEMDGIEFVNHLHEHYPDTLGKIPTYLSSAMGAFGTEVRIPEHVKIVGKPLDLDDFLSIAKLHLKS